MQSVCLETEVGFYLLSHFVLDGSHSAIASIDVRLFLSQPQDGSLTATSGSCGFVAQKAWEPHTGHTNALVDSLTGGLGSRRTSWTECRDSSGTLLVSASGTPEVPPEPPPFQLFSSSLFSVSCVSIFEVCSTVMYVSSELFMYVGSSYVLTIIKSHVLKFDPTENHYVFQLKPCTVVPTPLIHRRADELVEILAHHGNCSDTLLVNSLSLDPAVTDKISKILATKGAHGATSF